MLNPNSQMNLSITMLPKGSRKFGLKLNGLLLSMIVTALCSGCGKSAKLSASSEPARPSMAASASSAGVAEESVFKIAEEQRKALEQAKQLEQDLKSAADKRRREIETATGEN